MHRRRLLTFALVAAVLPMCVVGTTACSDDGHEPAMVEPDEVYVAIIRWQLARQAGTTGDSSLTTEVDAGLPVVYVAAADGSEISAQVQARVAAATVDDATIRFADSRDEVLDLNADDEPVNDDGVLLSVEQIEPDAARRRTTEVVVYRSLSDQQTWELTVDAAGDGAAVTSSTLQPS